ncbi:response regulator transcription factor [Paracoccus aminophilus]|uniref:Two component LuxR family transcriptional regulator n=1 Tax=Paracoccus aminophilus JCM 7686 TaxID=1367847 RepID=S5Y0X3_PARAH|nr:response regulator [Paracoccus aminophilus]AGT11147.1 two component LuxR family transcriptional regulator [Paracoccus aminophilus JCM 7686]
MPAPERPVILCIEDEPHLLGELVEELTALGFDAHGTPHPREAEDQIARLRPDLIICDIMMPERSGFEVLDQLRQSPETGVLPFIFLTALSDRDSQIRARRLGANDYLVKPVDFDLLEAAVRAKLDYIDRLRAPPPPGPETGPPSVHLSRRETQVLRELGLGLKISDIALLLAISEHTVAQYVKSVYSKLNISSRAEAAREAVRRRLLD